MQLVCCLFLKILIIIVLVPLGREKDHCPFGIEHEFENRMEILFPSSVGPFLEDMGLSCISGVARLLLVSLTYHFALSVNLAGSGSADHLTGLLDLFNFPWGSLLYS